MNDDAVYFSLLRIVDLPTKKFAFVLPALYQQALGLAVCIITAFLFLERGLDGYGYPWEVGRPVLLFFYERNDYDDDIAMGMGGRVPSCKYRDGALETLLCMFLSSSL